MLDNPPITLYVILSKEKTLIKSSTYTFKILPLPPQHARIKQPQQPGKKCSPERAIDAYWYGYCFRIEALAKQKYYYFRIYMLFLLDNTRGCIVNMREVLLHPYQDPSFAKKGGGAGISSFLFRMGHMFRNENKSSRQGG